MEEAFGFASAQVLHFADLYAGKLAAAVSRQHPRDLFDVGLLLNDERTDEMLWRTLLVYVTCSPKPAWEMLAPRAPEQFDAIFDAHFRGMTTESVSLASLLDDRHRLLSWMSYPTTITLTGQRDATLCAPIAGGRDDARKPAWKKLAGTVCSARRKGCLGD